MASPATVVIQQMTGAAPGGFHTRDANAVADKSGTRYMTADEYDSSLTSYPIPIPTAGGGVSGSYWVTHCLYCSDAPDTYLKNLRYYQGDWSTSPKVDWNLGSGSSWAAGLYIGVSSAGVADAKELSQGFPSGSYDQAAGGVGVYGDMISGNHTYYAGCSGPLSGGMIPITHFGSLANAFMVQSGQIMGATTGRSYCIVTQVLVGSGAVAGNKDDKTATFVYSEA